MASRARSLLSRLKLLQTPALGPQTEGTSAKVTGLRKVAVLFAKSVATYTACDAAAVIVAGQDISPTAQVQARGHCLQRAGHVPGHVPNDIVYP